MSSLPLRQDQTEEEWNSSKYKRDRRNAYPSVRDQLDMQYWDAVNGTTTWKDHVTKVKSDNPKPT